MARTLQEMTESHIGRQAYRTIELAVEVERLELLLAERDAQIQGLQDRLVALMPPADAAAEDHHG